MASPQSPLFLNLAWAKYWAQPLIPLSQDAVGFHACMLGKIWLKYYTNCPCFTNLSRRIARTQYMVLSNQNFDMLNVCKLSW